MTATFDLMELSNPILTFRYHMYGGSMGTLRVEVNDGRGWVLIELLSGQLSYGLDAPWGKAEADLSAYVSANTQVRFVGTTGLSFTSDMCVDDIWSYEGQELPARFEWTSINDRQTNGVPFPVQLTALNYSGQPLTGFTGPVELTAWSAGFDNACVNGDFEDGLNDWTPFADGTSQEDHFYAPSLYGSGWAFCFKPDAHDDGVSQVVNVSGGERYVVSAKYTVENQSASFAVNGSFSARILIDGVVLDRSYTYSTINNSSQYSYLLNGYFDVPESEMEGTRTISIVATSGINMNDFIRSYFDDVSVNFAPELFLDSSPGTSGEFVNGVWNGNVTMNYRLPAISLIARYGDLIGQSDSFTTYVSAYDLDGDGMLDNWEELYFPNAAVCVPSVDSDGDGYCNKDEFIIGTNPVLIDSDLGFCTRMSGENCILDWFSAENRSYDLQWTPNLMYTDFIDIATDMSFPQASFTNEVNGATGAGFYRIRVRKK